MTAALRDQAEHLRRVHERYAPPKTIGLKIERHPATPQTRNMREAVLEVVVEEVGPSHPEHRNPDTCPTITLARRALSALGLTQDEWTQDEIAILMGISRERVRQHENMGRARMVKALTRDKEAIVENLRTLDGLRRGWTLPEGYES